MLRQLAVLTVSMTAALSPAPARAASPAPLDDTGYWALADAMMLRLDRFWSDRHDSYRVGGGGADPSVNGQLLLAHAVAAHTAHAGPARNDRRARLVARRLVTGSAPFVEQPGGGSQAHAPGFTNSMDNPRGEQHLVFDAQVVDGLAAAWRARRELDLPAETSDLIADRLHRIAAGPFWRYPAIRLNQISWYALVYAAAADVAGDEHLLRRDLRLQIERFVRGIGPRGTAAGNLGPGGRFHYLPHAPASHSMNVDSAEYANVVIGVTRFLDRARAAGMSLSRRARARMRAWARRVIAGYWTHAGYLNWDTGLGFERWHQAKKLGLAQEALIGLASDDTLGLDARWRAWAKHMLDSGLRLYEREADRRGGIPAPLFFGVDAVPQGDASARLAAARHVANAARAVAAGLGSARSAQPPALYSYDPDIGRLAVTTALYNTAVVATNQRAFPYGGLELARLFDIDQDVAGTIGGTAPAAFGLVVRDSSGRRVLATQTGRTRLGRGAALRLLSAPGGVAARAASAGPGTVVAGPFDRLRVTGTRRRGGLAARVTHSFTPEDVTTAWKLVRRRTRRTLAARVQFPSHGPDATIQAVLRDGRVVTVRRRPLALRRVVELRVRSANSGYSVEVARAPRGSVVSALRVRAQESAPDPGPSLAVRIARGRGWREARLRVRITVRPELAA